ncbi:MAG: hypothetical protein HKO13_04855 [Sphingomonas sp.]|nr:hypothetical protein [Sphingomonas sp.]RZV50349.1 MAG: hypothetical protein EX258_05570 [Sphingomonadaceae bacterium]
MKHILLTTAALLAVSACARVEPIDTNEIEEVEPLAVENIIDDAAAIAGINEDFGWSIDGQRATYGPPDDDQLLALECRNGSLDVARFAQGTEGAGTLTFGAGAALASVAVAAGGASFGGDRYAATLAPGDIGDDMVEVFADGTPINVTMTGTAPLVVQSDAAVGRLVADCLGRERPADTNAPANEATTSGNSVD